MGIIEIEFIRLCLTLQNRNYFDFLMSTKKWQPTQPEGTGSHPLFNMQIPTTTISFCPTVKETFWYAICVKYKAKKRINVKDIL